MLAPQGLDRLTDCTSFQIVWPRERVDLVVAVPELSQDLVRVLTELGRVVADPVGLPGHASGLSDEGVGAGRGCSAS